MIHLRSVVLLVAALAVAGCANRNAAKHRHGRGCRGAPAVRHGAGLGPDEPAVFSGRPSVTVSLFEVDQFTLTGTARQVLDGQAQWLMTNGNYTAVIEGHADRAGHPGIQPRPGVTPRQRGARSTS